MNQTNNRNYTSKWIQIYTWCFYRPQGWIWARVSWGHVFL